MLFVDDQSLRQHFDRLSVTAQCDSSAQARPLGSFIFLKLSSHSRATTLLEIPYKRIFFKKFVFYPKILVCKTKVNYGCHNLRPVKH